MLLEHNNAELISKIHEFRIKIKHVLKKEAYGYEHKLLSPLGVNALDYLATSYGG